MAERPAIEQQGHDDGASVPPIPVPPPAVPPLPIPPLPPPPLAAAPRVFCVKCAADLMPLPPVARFCNRCGAPVPARFHDNPPAPSESASAAPPARPSPFRPPEILIAYAKALFNLGFRYETAVGSRRNLEEAARCYGKAARLSHAAAHAPIAPDAPPPFASVHRGPLS